MTKDDLATTPLLGVLRMRGEYHLIAVEEIPAGTVLFTLEGEVTTHPTRYSVQLDENTHIDLGTGHPLEQILDRYFWRFMNHHCEPSAWIQGREVIALRTIAPGEEITFDYDTTELEMAEPFTCRCGSPHCRGTIQGFQHLRPEERERLRPWLAPYLLHRLDTTNAVF